MEVLAYPACCTGSSAPPPPARARRRIYLGAQNFLMANLLIVRSIELKNPTLAPMLALVSAAAFTAYLQPGAAPVTRMSLSRVQGVRCVPTPPRTLPCFHRDRALTHALED